MRTTPTLNGYTSDEKHEGQGEFVLIDDLFKARADDKNPTPLLAFPRSKRGVSDFESFTGQDLDRFIEHAARHYLQAGLRVVSAVLCSGVG